MPARRQTGQTFLTTLPKCNASEWKMKKKVKSIEKEKLDSYKDHKKGLFDEDAPRAVLSDSEDKKTFAQMELNKETID